MEEIIDDLDSLSIPVAIELCHQDIISHQKPTPLFFALPRSSYIYCLVPIIAEAFAPFVADFGTAPNVWLDFQGSPLAWHHPVGAIADEGLLRGAKLPLVFVAHVTTESIPSGIVMANTPKDRINLTSQRCKEAAALIFGETKPFMNLHPDIVNTFAEFPLQTEVAPRFRLPHKDALKTMMRGSSKKINFYPVHVHCSEGGKLKGIPAERSEKMTFQEMLEYVLGEGFVLKECNKEKDNQTTTSTSSTHVDPTTTNEKNLSSLSSTEKKEQSSSAAVVFSDSQLHVLVNGTSPHPSTPFLWMWQNMCYGDLLLHVVILPKP